MKILVVSDSHSSLRFMDRCIAVMKPDCIIHLGDYYDDAQAVCENYPDIPLIQVPGNCDEYRAPVKAQRVLQLTLEGVRFFLTHGHLHQVKMTEAALIKDAQKSECQIALYGHTHVPACHREKSGLWVMNPGSCGYFGGSAGFVEVENGKIFVCKNIYAEDLEEML